jgi:chromosome segregation ATPase
MPRIASALLVASLCAVALRPLSAKADSAVEVRLREALRSTTSQLRALEDERARWQAKEPEQAKELESLRKELAGARRGAARDGDRKLSGRLAEQTEAIAKLAEANARLNEALAQCQKAAGAAEETGRAGEAGRTRLAAEVAELKKRLSASEARNERMYRVGKQIVDWASNADLTSAREPLLGLKRVELENAAQDHEDKLLQEKARP